MTLDDVRGWFEARGFECTNNAYDFEAERGELYLSIIESEKKLYSDEVFLAGEFMLGDRELTCEADIDALLADAERLAREGLEQTMAEAFPKEAGK